MTSPNAINIDYSSNEDVKELFEALGLEPGQPFSLTISGTVSSNDNDQFSGVIEKISDADETSVEVEEDEDAEEGETEEGEKETPSDAEVSSEAPILVAVVRGKNKK